MTENITNNTINLQNDTELLDKLPYAITVLDNLENIIYENAKASEIFGIRPDNACTSRWCHHSDYADNPCPMCPGKFTKVDKLNHKVFRKLLDSNLKIRYLEFETVPVLNASSEIDGYIEIVRDVTTGESIKVKNLQVNIANTKPRTFSLIKHGNSGSDIVFSEKIYFTDNLSEFLMKLASFAFIGVLQNSYERNGLYGPLPVLDEHNYEMFTYAFTLVDNSITDPRKHHQELVLLLIIFERNDKVVSVNRQLLNDMLSSYTFNLKSVNDLTQNWFDLIKIELNKLIDSED